MSVVSLINNVGTMSSSLKLKVCDWSAMMHELI